MWSAPAPACQIGGFALAIHKHALPHIDLEQLGENHPKAKETIAACGLPLLADGDGVENPAGRSGATKP
ncbi:MAG: hypothetical protein E5X48_06595 [Mesorhizobium sp.]|nr:MAG: hypothetical protein E5X48_06595 [Mesorhizobium sp.]